MSAPNASTVIQLDIFYNSKSVIKIKESHNDRKESSRSFLYQDLLFTVEITIAFNHINYTHEPQLKGRDTGKAQ